MKKKITGNGRVLAGLLCLVLLLVAGGFLYLHTCDAQTLRIGIFYGSNWEVPGTQQYDIFERAIEKFKETYPNVEVTYPEGIPSDDYSEWLSGQILKGEEPDVFIVLDDDFSTLSSIGALLPLDDLMESDADFDGELFYASALDAGNTGGVQYALPMECNPRLMFVNKTLLKENGIAIPENDWTWDDFYAICEQVTRDADGDGKIDEFGYYDYTWEDAAYSNGALPFDEEGTKAEFTSDAFVEALGFVQRLRETQAGYQVTSTDFDLGNVAFQPLSFSEYRTYMPYPWRIKKYSDFEWNCVLMPAGASGGNRSAMSTQMIGISAHTDNVKLAWEFVKRIALDEEIQTLVYEETSGASALKSVTTSQEVMELLNEDTPGQSEIDMSLLDQAIEAAVIPKRFANYSEIYERTDSGLNDLLDSEEDISLSLSQLQTEVEKMMRE